MIKFLVPAVALSMMAISPVSADEEETPLGQQMEIVNDSYKAFRRTDDPAEGTKLVREAQQAVIKGMSMTPDFVEKGGHPGGKEVAMVAFRKQMAKLLINLCEIEEAFLAKDMDKVQELIKPLRDSKKEAHKEFMEE